MKAALWVTALLTSALILADSARAEVVKTIDFDVPQGAIPSGYPNDPNITAAFGVHDDTGYLRKLQVWDARDFYQNYDPPPPDHGVAMDDFQEKSTNWGEVTLKLEDPDRYDIRLDSFLLCQYDDPLKEELILQEDDYPDLFVKIWYDDTADTYSYWELFDGENPLTLVTPGPTLAKSITIQWSFPFYLAIDNITYAVIPEPATVVPWVLGLALGLIGYRRYRRGRV